MKNSGLFLNMAIFCFFLGFYVLVVCFCVSGKVAKVLNMFVSLFLFFSSFLGFCGVAYSCLVGFRRFRRVCVSCFCFLFLFLFF